MKGIKNILRKNTLRILLFVVILLFAAYIFSGAFRWYLLNKDIDPNFIIGFLTSVTLILSLIQSSYDKKFSYNMRLTESIENKGLSIIGKLLLVKQRSQIYLDTLQQHKNAIQNKKIYHDVNNILIQKDINDGLDLIAAYIQTYFGEECLEWNVVQDKLNAMATYSGSIVLNYNKNISLIMEGINFKNESLDKIDYYIIESEKINKEIDEIALKMTEKITSKIKESMGGLKNSIDFKI